MSAIMRLFGSAEEAQSPPATRDTLNPQDAVELEESDTESIDVEDIREVNVRIAYERISALVEEVQSGLLDLDPWYQRRVIWPLPTKKALITTILYKKGYVPPIVLNEPKSGPRRAMDGKQRLATVAEFMENKFSTHDGRYFSQDPADRGKTLTADERKRFERTHMMCAVHSDLSAEQEKETFHDLQRGIPLTTGEKLRARDEQSVTFVRKLLLEHPALFIQNKAGPAREADLSNALRMTVAIHQDGIWIFDERRLSTWLQKYPTPQPHFVREIDNVFRRLWKLLGPTELLKRMKTAEVIALGYLLHGPLLNLDEKRLLTFAKQVNTAFAKSTKTQHGVSSATVGWVLKKYAELTGSDYPYPGKPRAPKTTGKK